MVCEISSVRRFIKLLSTNAIVPESHDEPQSAYVMEDSPPMVIDAAVEDVNSVRRGHRRGSGEFLCDGFAADPKDGAAWPQPVPHQLEKLNERG